ncbi:MAG: gliding motility-associated C-terminal domain-containing protein [Saprospiraceae bacterium]|nr:gliding motility-associated C-terminal domain-containing protein [Saprospiraceae bacterium]
MRVALFIFLFSYSPGITAQIFMEANFLKEPTNCNADPTIFFKLTNNTNQTIKNGKVMVSLGDMFNLQTVEGVDEIRFTADGNVEIGDLDPCQTVMLHLGFTQIACFPDSMVCFDASFNNTTAEICQQVKEIDFNITNLSLVRIGLLKYRRSFVIANNTSESLSTLLLKFGASDQYNVVSSNVSNDLILDEEFRQIGDQDASFDPGELLTVEQIIEIKQCSETIPDKIQLQIPCQGFENCFLLAESLDQPILNYSDVTSRLQASFSGYTFENCEHAVLRFTVNNMRELIYREPTIEITSNLGIQPNTVLIGNEALINKNGVFTTEGKDFSHENLVEGDFDGLMNDIGPNSYYTIYVRYDHRSIQELKEITLYIRSKNLCGGEVVSFAGIINPSGTGVSLSNTLTVERDPTYGNKSVTYHGDTVKITSLLLTPITFECTSPNVEITLSKPSWLSPLSDSSALVSYYRTDSTYVDSLGAFVKFGVREIIKYPIIDMGDSLKFFTSEVKTRVNLFDIYFLVSKPPGLAGEDCSTCEIPQPHYFSIQSRIRCQGDCIEINDTSMFVPTAVFAYHDKNEQLAYENLKVKFEEVSLKNYTSVFDNELNTIPAAQDVVILAGDSISENVIITPINLCELGPEDKLYLRTYYSDRANTYEYFDTLLEINILRSNGSVIKEVIKPESISRPNIAHYQLYKDVEALNYDLTPIFKTYRLSNTDSIYVRRGMRLGNLKLSAIVDHSVYELSMVKAECEKKNPVYIPYKYSKPAINLKASFDTRNRYYNNEIWALPDYYGEEVKLTFDLNYLEGHIPVTPPVYGTRAFYTFDSLVLEVPKNSHFIIEDSIFNLKGSFLQLLTREELSNKDIYIIKDINLLEAKSIENVIQIKAVFNNYINQNTGLEVTYYFKERDPLSQSFVQKQLSKTIKAQAIEFESIVSNKDTYADIEGTASWDLSYVNLSHLKIYKDDNYIFPPYDLFDGWLIIEKDAELTLALYDKDLGDTLQPIAAISNYLIFEVPRLHTTNNYRIIVHQAGCSERTIKVYSGFTKGKSFPEILGNLEGFLSPTILRIVEPVQFFSVQQSSSFIPDNCQDLRFALSIEHQGQQDIYLRGFSINQITPQSISRLIINGESQVFKIEGDSILLSIPVLLKKYDVGLFELNLNGKLNCPYFVNESQKLEILFSNICAEKKSSMTEFDALKHPEGINPKEQPLELNIHQTSTTCSTNQRSGISIKALGEIDQNTIFGIEPPSSISIEGITVSHADVEVNKEQNGILFIKFLENFKAGDSIHIEISYSDNCIISCGKKKWKSINYNGRNWCDCNVLFSSKKTEIPTTGVPGIRPEQVEVFSLDDGRPGIVFKPNIMDISSSFFVELYNDSDINNNVADADSLLFTKVLIQSDLTESDTLIFDIYPNQKACQFIFKIKDECGCDSLNVVYQTEQTGQGRIDYFPVCILDSLYFNLTLKPQENVIWPSSDYVFPSEDGGGYFYDPFFTQEDSLTLQVVDPYGCKEDYTLLFSPGIKGLRIDQSIIDACSDSTAYLISIKADNVIENIFVDDTQVDPDDSLVVKSGRHILKVQDEFNCQMQVKLDLVTQSTGNLTLVSKKDETCVNSSDGSIEIEIAGDSIISMTMNGQAIRQTLFNDLTPGEYVYEITNKYGCRDTLDVVIESGKTLIPGDSNIQAQCDGTKILFSDLESLFPETNLSYSFDNIAFSSSEDIIGANLNLKQTLFVRDSIGCTYTVPVKVELQDSQTPVIKTSGSFVQSLLTTILLINEEQFLDFDWWSGDFEIDCSSCTNLMLYPNKSGKVFFKGTDSNGCLLTDSIELSIESLASLTNQIPNIFDQNATQNSNHFIDFSAIGEYVKEITSLSIFDRYGNKIYTTSSSPFEWHGESGSVNVAPGVYVYVLEVRLNDRNESSHILRGSITLIK